MKEHPISFNTDMVEAIIAGRKTQTRRVIEPQPFAGQSEADIVRSIGGDCSGRRWEDVLVEAYDAGFVDLPCPYGHVGDVLWVREMFCVNSPTVCSFNPDRHAVDYFADCPSFVQVPKRQCRNNLRPIWRVPDFMSRELSRITLKIIDIRISPLQWISDAGVIAEGIKMVGNGFRDYSYCSSRKKSFGCPRQSFKSLWDVIYQKTEERWVSNPWVWVIVFDVVEIKGR